MQGNWDEGIGHKLFPKDQFYYDQLGPKRMRALLDFPMEHHCWISGKKMRLFHGRPILPEPYFVHEDYNLLAPLDREKDIIVDLYREDEDLFYVLRTPNHGTGNLITNLASCAICRSPLMRTG